MIDSKPLILATRGSALALWQAEFVSSLLTSKGFSSNLNIIKTTGDVVQDRFLHEIGGKGLFVKEIEAALLQGTADLAMHSLKDMPVKTPDELVIASVLKRHTHLDAIIFKKDLYPKLGLTPGQTLSEKEMKALGPMKVATSSLRRQTLLTSLKSGIEVVPIRGNVDTRLKKLESSDWHAIILAQASLERLAFKDLYFHSLEPSWFIPCAGQGAIAVETKRNTPTSDIAKSLGCLKTLQCITIERMVLEALGGDCTMPFGCLVTTDPRDTTHLLGRAVILDMKGNKAATSGSILLSDGNNERLLAQILLSGLKAAGAERILNQLSIQSYSFII
jgi:hydroxymethylbilane synthase